jgi:hypothetical protein
MMIATRRHGSITSVLPIHTCRPTCADEIIGTRSPQSSTACEAAGAVMPPALVTRTFPS